MTEIEVIHWVRLHILAFVIWHLCTRDLVLITFPLYFSSPLFKEASFQRHYRKDDSLTLKFDILNNETKEISLKTRSLNL